MYYLKMNGRRANLIVIFSSLNVLLMIISNIHILVYINMHDIMKIIVISTHTLCLYNIIYKQ